MHRGAGFKPNTVCHCPFAALHISPKSGHVFRRDDACRQPGGQEQEQQQRVVEEKGGTSQQPTLLSLMGAAAISFSFPLTCFHGSHPACLENLSHF